MNEHKYSDKVCGLCNNKTITYKNWARHLKTQKHLRNDPDQTLRPRRRTRKPPKIFTNPRKAHRVFDLKDGLFDETPNIKTAVSKTETAFLDRLQTYMITNTMVVKEVIKIKRKRKRNLRKKTITNRELKVNVVVPAEFERRGEEFKQMTFKTKNKILTAASDLTEFYSKVKNKILNEMEEMELKGSNWNLTRILYLELRINRYNSLRGASYLPLPKALANKKAVINVKIRITSVSCGLFSRLYIL